MSRRFSGGFWRRERAREAVTIHIHNQYPSLQHLSIDSMDKGRQPSDRRRGTWGALSRFGPAVDAKFEKR